jgi:AraC-like DNA-binding protein
MLFDLLYILTSLLGFLIITLIAIWYKSNRIINIYLLVVFLLLSIKFLIHGLIDLKIFTFINHDNISYFPFFSIGIPSLYLYFKNLVNDTKTFNKNELKHFIFPVLLGFYTLLLDQFYILSFYSSFILYSIFIIFHSFYIFLSFQFLKKNIWQRKAELFNADQQNNLLIKWTTFLFIFSCLISLRLFVSLSLGVMNHRYTYGQNYQWISAILLDLIYIKILSSPQILYGYNALYKKIKKHRDSNFILRDLWIITPTEPITNSQDLILQEKIEAYITTYLQNIETLVLRYEILRNPLVSLTDIANKLEIPKSHITFVFKYHSKVSFTEFKKIIRIYDALHLIEENYLKSNTLESLATKVGFSSYNPFFITFKDITGTTPQIYYKEHTNS